MKINALIIDDEAPARMLIREFLKLHPSVTSIGECTDGFEGAKAIQERKPDLVFLDIQMPKLSGLEMLEILDADSLPSVIFVTAHDDYALKAFEVNAVDYLMKPVAQERFDLAVRKALARIRKGTGNQREVSSLVGMEGAGPKWLDRIVARADGEIHLIAEEDICCLEARDDYVLICTEKEEFLKKKTLKFYEQKLDPSRFTRVHRSFLVRVDTIQRIEPYSKDAFVAILKSGRKIGVSKQGYASLRKQFDF
jgi:two-component system, LytTR family, response regulator